MARIRTIKPEFFLHEDLAEISMAARLAFIGVWTQADREGRLEDRPKRLKAVLFPYETVDFDGLLSELHQAGFINRYLVNDVAYIEIPGFARHQLIGRNEPPSEIPSSCGEISQIDRAPNGTVRQRVYERDGFCCVYCGEDMKAESRKRCVDHVFPLSQGGTHALINLVTACKRCNERKGGRTPEEAGMPWPDSYGETYESRGNDPVNGGSTGTLTGASPGKEGKGRERNGSRSSDDDPLFAEFWSAYPKREAKPPAKRAFARLSEVDKRDAIAGVGNWLASGRWDDGRFIPQPATYLNQRRWEDEITTAAVVDLYGRGTG